MTAKSIDSIGDKPPLLLAFTPVEGEDPPPTEDDEGAPDNIEYVSDQHRREPKLIHESVAPEYPHGSRNPESPGDEVKTQGDAIHL